MELVLSIICLVLVVLTYLVLEAIKTMKKGIEEISRYNSIISLSEKVGRATHEIVSIKKSLNEIQNK